MIRLRTLALLAALACAALVPLVPAGEPAKGGETFAPPFHYPEGRHGKGELRYVRGVPVLVVGGTPEEIGEAVGALAVKPAGRALDYPRGLLRAVGAERFYALAVAVGQTMYKHFPDDYRTELGAMARGGGVRPDPLVLGNTLFDLHKNFLCSSLLVRAGRSATGGPLLGRNLDYPSLGYIHEYSLVTVYRPAGKHAFAAVGFPGLVGCLSGINDAGLSLAVLETYKARDGEPRFDADGVPYALCQRKLLEECTTIAEAQKLLAGLHRTTTNNLVVADRTGVAVLEVTPGHVVRRDVGPGTGACTNHFCTAALKPEEPVNFADSFGRFATLEKACAGTGKLTPEDVRKELDLVNLGRLTLQTMVFEPATLRLHLAVGERPASAGPLHTLDLKPLLQGKGFARGDYTPARPPR